MAAALLGVLLAVPAARAWADDAVVTPLMAHFGLTHTPVRLGKPAMGVGTEGLGREQAQARVGFPPLVPAYLPAGYPAPASFMVWPDAHRSWWRVIRFNGPWTSAERIDLQQQRARAGQGPNGVGAEGVGADQQPLQVTVAGVPALWFDLPDSMSLDKATGKISVVRYKHVLLWERDGFQYTLGAPESVGRDEAVRIAESLH